MLFQVSTLVWYIIDLLQHALVEVEAESIRSSVVNAVQHMRSLMEDMSETVHRLGEFTHYHVHFNTFTASQVHGVLFRIYVQWCDGK